MEILQLLFSIHDLPGHMVRAKEMLVDIKVHCSTVQTACILLFLEVHSLLNMPKFVRLHECMKEIWDGFNENYVCPVND